MKTRNDPMAEDAMYRATCLSLVKALVVCLICGLILVGLPEQVRGQATPGALPPTSCADQATPEATPSALSSVQAERRLSIVIATERLIACRNEQDWASVVALMRPQYLEQQFGAADPVLARETLSSMHAMGFLPPLVVQTMGEPTASPAFGSINVNVLEGFVVRRQEWHFVMENDAWLLSDVNELAPLFDVIAVGIPVTLESGGLKAIRTELVNPGAIVFDFVNATDDSAAVAVFALVASSGTDVRGAVIQGVPPDPAAAIGWAEVPPGEISSMAFIGLPPGRYLVVSGYDPRIDPEPIDESAMVEISIENP
jgi:hypothetical protein